MLNSTQKKPDSLDCRAHHQTKMKNNPCLFEAQTAKPAADG